MSKMITIPVEAHEDTQRSIANRDRIISELHADLAKCKEDYAVNFLDKNQIIIDSQQRIHQLEAERDAIKGRQGAINQRYEACLSRADYFEKRINTLVAGLMRCGKHLMSCTLAEQDWGTADDACTCGLTDLIGGKP